MDKNRKQTDDKTNFIEQRKGEIANSIRMKEIIEIFKEEAIQWKSRELEEEQAKQRELKEFKDKLEGKGLTEEDKKEGITIPIEFDGGLTRDALHL